MSFGWFGRLTEPVRIKRFPAAEHTQPAFVSLVETLTLDKWFQWLSQPVRVKLGLLPDAQQFLVDTPRPPAVTGTGETSSVFTSIVYVKDLLYPALQEPVPIVIVSIVDLTLNVTETGDIFSGTLQFGYCPQADVSIVEIVPTTSVAGSTYVPDVFAEVSIIEVRQNVVYVEVSIIETC